MTREQMIAFYRARAEAYRKMQNNPINPAYDDENIEYGIRHNETAALVAETYLNPNAQFRS